MKLNGTFLLRNVAQEWLAIPVGDAALRFGGMVILNPVSHVIWECLQNECRFEDIVAAVTQRFDISDQEAATDVQAFLDKMRQENLIIE